MKLEVAVGVLLNQNHEVLIGQRTRQDRYYEQWEFPGGKLEPGESPDQALVRELAEELGITVTGWQPLIEVEHQYPDRHVYLYVFTVNEYEGIPRGVESQSLQWVAPDDLDNVDFLSGNQRIVEAVKAL